MSDEGPRELAHLNVLCTVGNAEWVVHHLYPEEMVSTDDNKVGMIKQPDSSMCWQYDHIIII